MKLLIAISSILTVTGKAAALWTPLPPRTNEPPLQPAALRGRRVASINDLAVQTLAQAREAIVALVQSNARLSPEFLRMGFHDCITVCDGESTYRKIL